MLSLEELQNYGFRKAVGPDGILNMKVLRLACSVICAPYFTPKPSFLLYVSQMALSII